MKEYNHKQIENKWQKIWEESDLYKADDSKKDKQYLLVEFPYPSGAGLHVGHARSYTALDIMARKLRMEGKNVLYPIGWDAFGLPTENYAIKNKIHPRQATEENVATFTKQLKSLGFSFDWSREINTTDPEYYKWTQWIFLQLYKKDLAYKKKMAINWCPSCKIGLAHEEVVNGKCERCGTEVEQRDKEQWMLAITKYADRLIKDLDNVNYLEKIKTQQINWIGRSEGININYKIKEVRKDVSVFTTRPDTNFGATFLTLAPDSDFVKENLDSFPNKKEVEEYVKQTSKKTDLERIAEGKKKTGVFTGWHAVNNLNNYEMPIYVGDFVLASVGTGAVVGVPGHDIRDFEFAQAIKLDIIRVVVGSDGDTSAITKPEQVQEKEGTMINSDFLDGLDIHKATEKIKDYLEEKKWGERVVRYKLRDWVFSRQHYWGEPIPMVSCKKCGWVPVPEKDLPVELPDVKNYEPTNTGESPLANITDWVNTKCPKCGGDARRETDTMPNWAGSSWYFLRYCDPQNNKEFASEDKLKQWTPVDLYNGGMEHTTLHLLYSRFWHKFLYDQKLVPTPEPYTKRVSHGMVLAEDGKKMSKSLGNVINPDEIIENIGADSLRLYEMFMGPFSETIPWSTEGVKGVRRFLEKIWDYCQSWKKSYEKDFKDNIKNKESKDDGPDKRREIMLHKTIEKVTKDIENMKFNTAVSAMMIFVNYIKDKRYEVNLDIYQLEKFLIILAPFAPHLAEELFEILGNKESIFKQEWPKYDESLIKEKNIKLVIQINGKVRDSIEVEIDMSEEDVKEKAMASEKIKKWVSDKEIIKVIFVKNKLINIVIKN